MASVKFLEQARDEKTCIHAEMMYITKSQDRAMLINLATEEPSKFDDLIGAAQAFQSLQDWEVTPEGEARVITKPGFDKAFQNFENLFWVHVPMYVKSPSFEEVKVDFKMLMKAVKNIAYCLAH